MTVQNYIWIFEPLILSGIGGFFQGGVGKSTSVYCIGAGLAMNGKKVLLLDVDPQGDLTKMLGQRKPHEMPLTLANVMNDIVAGVESDGRLEIMHHAEGFDFVPANREP